MWYPAVLIKKWVNYSAWLKMVQVLANAEVVWVLSFKF
jgi:hypothetical protein